MGFDWTHPFSQRNPSWAGHALGSGAGELGLYGCYETVFTMVYNDAYGANYNPAEFDDLLWKDGVFSGDLLPDNALDRAFPGRFQTTVEYGFNQGKVNAAIASPDTYAIVCIHNPAAGVSGYHFMLMYQPTEVVDPWWGRIMAFSSWGGPSVVVKTIYVKSLKAQVDAAAAQAAAAAKAQADAAAALAAAQQAAADAKAKADAAAAAQAAAAAEAAKEAAAADAREAAAQAAAEAAARAESVAAGKATPPTKAPAPDFWAWLQVVILALLGRG